MKLFINLFEVSNSATRKNLLRLNFTSSIYRRIEYIGEFKIVQNNNASSGVSVTFKLNFSIGIWLFTLRMLCFL